MHDLADLVRARRQPCELKIARGVGDRGGIAEGEAPAILQIEVDGVAAQPRLPGIDYPVAVKVHEDLACDRAIAIRKSGKSVAMVGAAQLRQIHVIQNRVDGTGVGAPVAATAGAATAGVSAVIVGRLTEGDAKGRRRSAEWVIQQADGAVEQVHAEHAADLGGNRNHGHRDIGKLHDAAALARQVQFAQRKFRSLGTAACPGDANPAGGMSDIQAQRQGGLGRNGRDLGAGVEQEVQMTE